MATRKSQDSEVRALRAEVAELQARLVRLEQSGPRASRDSDIEPGSPASPWPSQPEVMSRRSVLRSLAGAGTGAALGAVAVVMSAAPSGAADGDNVKAGQTTTATQATKVVRGSESSTSDGTFAALWGDQADEVGVVGSTTSSIGVLGVSKNATGAFGKGGFVGVGGEATFLNPLTIGVSGRAGIGVLGQGSIEHSSAPVGVEGRSANAGGIGVKGSNPSFIGVQGEGATGLRGIGTASNGFGVDGSSTVSTAIGVNGSNPNNVGVQGFGKIGVQGLSFTGVGGSFTGGGAAIRLVPKAGAGAPTAGVHSRGELVVDSVGSLFVCTANGTPGTWRKVSTTPA